MQSEVETLAGASTQQSERRSGSGGASRSEPAELARGELLGRYVVLEPVGVGGMGMVYAAYDPQLDRKVAVKLVRSQGEPGTLGSGRLRLLREAQALAKLSHPNVVAVHDAGTIDERVFVAMEFIDGVSLRTWLAAAPRRWPEIVAVFVDAARGLAAAHECGLVHRDFKPDNVMIERGGRVVVMDFGLARPVRVGDEQNQPVSDRAIDGHLTEHGSLLGTPAYMAPEQLAGGEADARADQFGFCVALHEALYGVRPFAGRTLVELATAILAGTIVPEPRGRAVPGWLRAVIMRGLASDPDARHTSMRALMVALTRNPSRRRRSVALLAGGFVLVTLLGVLARVRHERREAEQLAACAREGAAIEAIWSDEARRALARSLLATGSPHSRESFDRVSAWIDPFVRRWSSERTQVCRAARVEQQLSREREAEAIACLDEQAERLAIVLELFGEADLALVAGVGKAAAAFSQFESCTDERVLAQRPRTRGPRGDPRRAAVRRGLVRATALSDAGEFGEAQPLARAALADAVAFGDASLEAEALLVVATIESEIGDYAEVLSLGRHAFSLSLASGSDELAARAAIALLRVLGYHLARPEEGLVWAEVAYALLERIDRSESLDAAQLANNVALVHEQRGALDLAQTEHRRALDLRTRLLGPAHPETGHSYGNLGNLARLHGDLDGALVWHRRALDVREAGLGAGHPDVGRSHANLGRVALAQGDLDSAYAHFEQSLAILAPTLGLDHRVAARLLADLGEVHRRRGALAQARSYFERALGIQHRLIGPRHLETGQSWLGLARVELAAKRLAQVDVALAAAALALDELPPQHASRRELDALRSSRAHAGVEG